MSKAIKAYQSGLSFLLSSKKIWFLIYGLNVGFAILIALPLNNYLQSTISDSLATNNEFIKFNYTYINDFLANHGSGLGVIFNTSIYVLIIYFIIMVFISGGIVTIIQNKEKYQDFSNFWKGGASLFWRFLRVDLYFIILYLITAFIGFSIFQIGGFSIFNLETEMGLINRFYIIAIAITALFLFFGMVHMYAKLFIAKANKIFIHEEVLKAFSFCFRNFLTVLLLGVINLLVFGFFAALYFWFRKHYHFSNSSILLLFILGQFFILFRIACRIVRAASYEALRE
jgi:hypothetical protein